MSRLTRDETVEPISRGQILRRERGQGNLHFPCTADHEQDWQSYPVDPHSCYMVITIHPHNLLNIKHTKNQPERANRNSHVMLCSYEVLRIFIPPPPPASIVI